jgi:LacI family transcriptional regulator
MKELTESRIPVVSTMSARRGETSPTYESTTGGALRRLSGHRRLGFVGHHARLAPINERTRAVLDAVARSPSLEVKTAADADTLEGGRQARRTLLASGDS